MGGAAAGVFQRPTFGVIRSAITPYAGFPLRDLNGEPSRHLVPLLMPQMAWKMAVVAALPG